MLLLHQAGSVKIGEVVRYTVTYTPAYDRILPSPSHLHLKIKNTSAIALRAAFIHGPYTLYAAAYPSNFNPNSKFDNPQRDGVPEFEPNLKAGGSFSTELVVPEDVRTSAGTLARDGRSPTRDDNGVKSVSWIVEVSSQVIFSTSAVVHYEMLLGRDEKSLSLGVAPSITGGTAAVPGQVSDHQQSHGAKDGRHNAQPKGIYSRAIKIKVDDTASLWNTPKMPEWDNSAKDMSGASIKDAPVDSAVKEKVEDTPGHRGKGQKRVHLVVLTHGLHSNLGADMLYLKESIDVTAKQAKIDKRARRAKERAKYFRKATDNGELGVRAPDQPTEQEADDEDDDEEEVIVRGFSGNAVRTERGIKYLGKRLAKYILVMTYPDQPYRPVTKKTAAEALSHALKPDNLKPKDDGTPAYQHSTIEKEPYHDKKLPYKITSISFIAHSLGGLIQTYAVAYIQKHSPEFFDVIEPINFIAMASPFLGLSNENPLYVKFALDFGLVGRTGKDLGLTWRAPTIARSGWGAIVGGIGESAHKKIDGEVSPESKPLLRILPTGPAHIVLKKFRNRTVYSNVVNDGIVPLRTSCLLFLDWSGLGRVEKARRENGLVGTMAGWGWAEITGQNSSSPMRRTFSDSASSENDAGDNTPTKQGHGGEVPQPSPDAAVEDDTRSLRNDPTNERPKSSLSATGNNSAISTPASGSTTPSTTGPLASILGLFRPNPSPKPQNDHPKHTKIYKRSQTININNNSSTPSISTTASSPPKNSRATSGDSDHEDFDRLSAPPKTTFFESAGDVLKPPLPSVDFFINPAHRPRTIFHDRVYHPEDIPPPPFKKRPSSSMMQRRRPSLNSETPIKAPPPHTDSALSARDYDDTKHTNPDKDPRDVVDGSAMKVEEKIARAYHRDLSWRKVLVRLEPDAHNNMIVRRMFANAYGWPVIHHLCETHFSDSAEANTRDEDETNDERAKESHQAPDSEGGEVRHSKPKDRAIKPLQASDRTNSEKQEATDEVPDLNPKPRPSNLRNALANQGGSRRLMADKAEPDSEPWSEHEWADSGDDSDDEDSHSENRSPADVKKSAWNWAEVQQVVVGKGSTSPKGTDKALIEEFLGKKKHGEVDQSLVNDAAAARMMSGEAAGMDIGLESALSRPKMGDGVQKEHVT
jgi:hypothetical protein